MAAAQHSVAQDELRTLRTKYDEAVALVSEARRQLRESEARREEHATAVAERDCEVVAVDNSTAMLEELQLRLASAPPPIPVRAVLADITGIAIDRDSVVALNYSLQFVPVAQRDNLLARIHRGLVEDGVMILSEKIRFDDPQMEALMVDLYHAFKRRQGYSELEIAQKRSALENVLVPEALEVHRRRLTAAGFSRVDTWFQCFNFASLVAFK